MDLVRAVWAAGALVIPGLLLARALDLGTGTAERWAVGCAVGRLLLSGVTLAGAAIGIPALAPAWAGLAWAAGAGAVAMRWRSGAAGRSVAGARSDGEARASALALLALVVLALAVAAAVVGHSGLASPDGGLVFYGRHPTNDSLVYAAFAAQAEVHPPPLPSPFLAGVETPVHPLFFAELAGLAGASGLDRVDVAFRLRPALDLVALVVTAFALARRLGATPLGAGLGAGLVLLGGGLAQPLFWIGRALGAPLNELELWAYGTSFLVPVNPVAPGLQTAWSALLLLSAGAVSRRAAVVAGLLVASVFALKATLWISVLPALVIAAWAWRGGVPARTAALVAVLASLPLVATSPGVVPADAALAPASLRFCLACFPRYAIASVFQDPFAMRQLFDAFDPSALASPRFWLGSLASSAVYLGVTLGVALLAWPARPRGALVPRVLGLSLGIGALATCAVDLPPHFVNDGQFAWCAALGAWPLLGVRLGRWIAAGHRARAALVVALALPSGVWWIVAQGARAPLVDRVTAQERALADAVATHVPRDAVVLEPTLLVEPTRASVVAWLGGRRVYANKAGMLDYLAPAERARRSELVQRAYESPERDAALAALDKTGARFVVLSAGLGAALEGSPRLRAVYANDAGALFEVMPAPDARGE